MWFSELTQLDRRGGFYGGNLALAVGADLEEGALAALGVVEGAEGLA